MRMFYVHIAAFGRYKIMHSGFYGIMTVVKIRFWDSEASRVSSNNSGRRYPRLLSS